MGRCYALLSMCQEDGWMIIYVSSSGCVVIHPLWMLSDPKVWKVWRGCWWLPHP